MEIERCFEIHANVAYSILSAVFALNNVGGLGIWLILFLTNSKLEKKIVLIKHDRAIDTPIPEYMLRLKNSILGRGTGVPLLIERQLRW